MRNLKKLMTGEFDILLPHLDRFDEKNIAAVRRVLVEGARQKDIAAELELTKEAVSAMVGRAWKIHLTHGERPAGWRKVEVVLPPEYAEMVEELANIARTKARR